MGTVVVLEKSLHKRIRRAAARRGWRASLSHRQDPNAVDHGMWQLASTATGLPAIAGRFGYTLNLDEVLVELNLQR